MTAPIVEQTVQDSSTTAPKIPPSVLIIGKKDTLDYVAPALSRINNTGELIIKATGSLSIVTAVDIAEIVRRTVAGIKTESITIGTDEMRVSSGELKPMSFIQIRLVKNNPTGVGVKSQVDMHVPAAQITAAVVNAPEAQSRIKETTSPAKVDSISAPEIADAKKTKKTRVKRKTTTASTTKTVRKKKSQA